MRGKSKLMVSLSHARRVASTSLPGFRWSEWISRPGESSQIHPDSTSTRGRGATAPCCRRGSDWRTFFEHQRSQRDAVPLVAKDVRKERSPEAASLELHSSDLPHAGGAAAQSSSRFVNLRRPHTYTGVFATGLRFATSNGESSDGVVAGREAIA